MTSVLFNGLVAVMVSLAGVALLRASVGESGSGRVWSRFLVFVLAYVVVPALLAASGWLDRYDPLPAPALVMVLGLTIITIGFVASPSGERLALAIPTAALVGFQAFRVPVELLLHRLALEGAIPEVMTYAGRNFDIVAGVTGGILGLWLIRREIPPLILHLWNVGCLALLANIVTIAVLSTPVPFRSFTEGPPNVLPSTFPYVWLPTVLVQLALAGHLLLYRKLRAVTGTSPDPLHRLPENR